MKFRLIAIIFAALMTMLSCRQDKNTETIVAKVGDQVITGKEFRLNYEWVFRILNLVKIQNAPTWRP